MWCPSVSFSVWANAWLAGQAAPDDVLDALSAWAPIHSVTAYDAVAAGRTGLPWPDVDAAGAMSLLQTVRTAAGVLVKEMTIAFVDADNLTLTFNAGDLVGVVAGNVLWFQGASATTETVGIKTLLLNTGTAYNINAAEYSLWRGNRITAAATTDLGFRLATQLDARIRSRGGMGEQLGICNPDVFTTLLKTIEAARDFGGDQYKNTDIDRGTRRIRFYTPTGTTEVVAHPLCKRGDYFSLRKGKWNRAGACDATFNIPGEGGKVLFDLQDYPGKELRMMADNTWVSRKPAASGMITGITYGGSVST
jgi:hypothetical protein